MEIYRHLPSIVKSNVDKYTSLMDPMGMIFEGSLTIPKLASPISPKKNGKTTRCWWGWFLYIPASSHMWPWHCQDSRTLQAEWKILGVTLHWQTDPNRSPTKVFPLHGESGATSKDQGGVSQDLPPARRCRAIFEWMTLIAFLGSFSSKVRCESAAIPFPFHLNVHCCSGQILQQDRIEQLSMARFRIFC